MKISGQIQNVIHELEVGRGARWVPAAALLVGMLALALVYDLTAYKGYSSVEAMDAAQVARNLAEGKGFTTDFIRPFSIYLLGEHAATNKEAAIRIAGNHPDLSNAPLYPLALAAMFKVCKPGGEVDTRNQFWSSGGLFLRHKPEFLVAIANQILLIGVVALTFLVARQIFNIQIAMLGALMTLGAEILWRFSVSGQSTMVVILIFLCLVRLMLAIENRAHDDNPDPRRLFMMSGALGLLAGAAMMTRYSVGWVMVPVLAWIYFFGGGRRAGLATTALLVFMVTIVPWLVRNLFMSGTLFGTAGYAVLEGTFVFPGSSLMQTLNPDMSSAYWLRPYMRKLLENIRGVLQVDLFRTMGWVSVLFFAGLLLPIRTRQGRRMLLFSVMCLAVLVVVQSLGKTAYSAIAPDINSENLLVLLVPMFAIFGAAFLMEMLDRMELPSLDARYGVVVLASLACCYPLLVTLLPPRSSPLAYPPYNPVEIQRISAWNKPEELMMSDIPWAVAWYGDRQCSWATVDSRKEFEYLNDYVKHVSGLYLSLDTLNVKMWSDALQGGGNWGNFVINTLMKGSLPEHFPLRVMPAGMVSGWYFADRERWVTDSGP